MFNETFKEIKADEIAAAVIAEKFAPAAKSNEFTI